MVPVHGFNENTLIPEQAKRREVQLPILIVVRPGYLIEHFICDVI